MCLGAEEAATQHEKVFRAWRESPHTFTIDGRSPVTEVFKEARGAWEGQQPIATPRSSIGGSPA